MCFSPTTMSTVKLSQDFSARAETIGRIKDKTNRIYEERFRGKFDVEPEDEENLGNKPSSFLLTAVLPSKLRFVVKCLS